MLSAIVIYLNENDAGPGFYRLASLMGLLPATRGEFTRHSRPDTDEFFLVLRGSLIIKMDAGDVELGPGQMSHRDG